MLSYSEADDVCFGSQAALLLDITRMSASECKADIHELILEGPIAIP